MEESELFSYLRIAKTPVIILAFVVSATYAYMGELPLLEENSKFLVLGCCLFGLVLYYLFHLQEETEQEPEGYNQTVPTSNEQYYKEAPMPQPKKQKFTKEEIEQINRESKRINKEENLFQGFD